MQMNHVHRRPEDLSLTQLWPHTSAENGSASE